MPLFKKRFIKNFNNHTSISLFKPRYEIYIKLSKAELCKFCDNIINEAQNHFRKVKSYANG